MHADKRETSARYGGRHLRLRGMKDLKTATHSARRITHRLAPLPFRIRSSRWPSSQDKADQEKMGVALSRLADEDPPSRCGRMKIPGRRSSAAWRTALEILVDRMKREHKSRPMWVSPRLPSARPFARRPRLRASTSARRRLGQLRPLQAARRANTPARAMSLSTKSRAFDSQGVHQAIDQGVQARSSWHSGRLSAGGHQGDPVRRQLPRSGFHEMAFKFAGSIASRKPRQGQPVLLEP